MVNRVTTPEVKEIITTDKVDIDPFIIAANSLVTEVLGSSGLGTTRLKEIERWLSAHFITHAGSDTSPGQVVEKSIGETRERYSEGQASFGELDSTRYGKMAILLDTTGKLAGLGKPRALFTVVAP